MKSKQKQKVNVVLADDHVLLRDALASLINSFEDCGVSYAVGNGVELLQYLRAGNNHPDLVLLDLNMPQMDGFETAAELYKNFPGLPSLILTMYDSEIALIRLLKVGVRGFLKKDIHPGELHAAIKTVADGGYYYSNHTTGKLAGLFQRHHDTHTSLEKSLLNDRELEFLRHASSELTYKEIAGEMNLSPRAIDCCRDALFEKLDVKSRVGLAIYAVKHGIVTL